MCIELILVSYIKPHAKNKDIDKERKQCDGTNIG